MDVLPDLPEKIRSVQPIELSNREEYDLEEEAFREWANNPMRRKMKKLDPQQQAEALVHIERMKQLCIKGKLKNAIGWIEDFLETEDKLVLFTTHQKTVDVLQDKLHKYNPVTIDGRVSPDVRFDLVDAFQTDPTCRVFIGNIKAAGIGITLTAASATCFLELGWTPGEHDQAEDRVHRIGQEADSVMAYYLLSINTIEERIASLLDRKRAVLASVLDGKEVESESMLMELVNQYKEI